MQRQGNLAAAMQADAAAGDFIGEGKLALAHDTNLFCYSSRSNLGPAAMVFKSLFITIYYKRRMLILIIQYIMGCLRNIYDYSGRERNSP
jgi:hypothetical protein